MREGVDGLHVDPTDADALAAAIIALARDPARRAAMGAAGRERAFGEYSAETMAARAWSLAADVAARRPIG